MLAKKKENDTNNKTRQTMKQEPRTFGEFFQQKRIECGFTLRGLAEELKCSAPYLTDIEKGRRNPPEMERLEKLVVLFRLSDEEKKMMLDLAGKMRETIAPDLPEYIMGKDYVAAALRTARDLGASEDDWEFMVKELLERRKKKEEK